MDLSRARNLWETRERELRARESVTSAQMVDKMTSGRSQRVVEVQDRKSVV